MADRNCFGSLSAEEIEQGSQIIQSLGFELINPQILNSMEDLDNLEDILLASDYNDNFAFSGVYDFDPEMIYDATDFLPLIKGIAKAAGTEDRLCNMSARFVENDPYWNKMLVRYQFDGVDKEYLVHQRNDWVDADFFHLVLADVGYRLDCVLYTCANPYSDTTVGYNDADIIWVKRDKVAQFRQVLSGFGEYRAEVERYEQTAVWYNEDEWYTLDSYPVAKPLGRI